jgi:MOSC domain-containing protein YiiM
VKDPEIMNTAYCHSGNNLGVYARVFEGGRVGLDDRVALV